MMIGLSSFAAFYRAATTSVSHVDLEVPPTGLTRSSCLGFLGSYWSHLRRTKVAGLLQALELFYEQRD
jgi:hypothetical protein